MVTVSPTTSPTSSTGLHRGGAISMAGHRLRASAWQGNRDIALLGPARTNRAPTAADVRRALDHLAGRGVRRVITAALSPFEAEPFHQAGFEIHEHLHLLARPIDGPPPAVTVPLRQARPWERTQVLDIDGRAFEPFWRFDAFALREARRATPTNRFTVATSAGRVGGYAVTGRAGGRGYLQRLAVEPGMEGRGLGTSLVHDAIAWLHRKGVGMVLVNTQERNRRALALYEYLGFVRQRDGLVVLSSDLPSGLGG